VLKRHRIEKVSVLSEFEEFFVVLDGIGFVVVVSKIFD
jgi:hypothetical protein